MTEAIEAVLRLARLLVNDHPEWVSGGIDFADGNALLRIAREEAGGSDALDALVSEHVGIPFVFRGLT